MTLRLEWFALRVEPRKDLAVCGALCRRGIEDLLPIYRGRRRLFPGFVFGRFDYRNRDKVMEIPWIDSILGTPASPTPIPDAEIASLQTILSSQLPVKPCAFVAAGQPVRISRGPLAGVEGFLVRKRDDFEIVVGVEALQRAVAVRIDREMVRAVEGGPHADLARLLLTV